MHALIYGAGAISDVGGMGMVGTLGGAAGGIALLPAFGVGWGIDTLANPYVQPLIPGPTYNPNPNLH